jgi:hypothetical protein
MNYFMGIKLAWSGLALLLAFTTLNFGHAWVVAGAIVLVIGVILIWLDK